MKFDLFRYLSLSLFIIAVFCTKNFAQQLSNQKDEEKVKLSNDYYWEEVRGFTIEGAKDSARETLLIDIIKDFNSKENLQDAKAIHVEGIDYLIFKSGPKYRVTAFIEKANVTKQVERLKEMGYYEVVHSDKEKDEESDFSGNLSQNQLSDSTNRNNYHPQLNIELNNDLIDSSGNNEDEISENLNMGKNIITELPDESLYPHYNQSVVQELAGSKNIDELLKLLNEYQKKGKLVYGKKESFPDPGKCDVVVINPETKIIQAYLVQKDNIMYNYLTQDIITNFKSTFKDMIAIWIMYLEE